MGYCISQVDSSFRIKEENLKPAYKAVKESMAGKAYHWQEENWMKGLRDLVAVLEDWRYDAEVDEETGDIIDLQFTGEKLGDELELFKVIAPFVEAGSYLEISGEDSSVWRWIFDGRTCVEKYAEFDFDDKPKTVKVKFGYYVQNNGDGSASVLFFKNAENAEAYAGDDDERFTDGDTGEETLEFDLDGNLLTPERTKE